MSRKEALKILDTIPTIGEQVDALEMAIRSLGAWDAVLHEIGSLGLSWEYGRGVWDCYNIIKKHLEEVEE